MAVTLRNAVTLNGGLHMDTWSPQLLFPAATQDVWYDPSDINLTWRRNLEVQTEDFSSTYCLHQGVNYVANQVASPMGTITADLITENNATNSDHRLGRNAASLSISSGATYTGSVYVKRASGTRNVILRIDLGSGNFGLAGINFDLTNLIVTPTAGQSGTITVVGDGWYKLTITATSSTTYTPNYSLSIILSNGTTPSNIMYNGDNTSGIYVWGAQLEVGSTATPYQRITDGVVDYLNYSASLPVMFQDYQGTLPTSQVEQPVGLMLDKSQGLVLGSEINPDVEFDTPGSWTLSGTPTISGSAVNFTGINSSARILVSPPATGSLVKINFTVTGSATQGINIGLRFGGGSNLTATAFITTAGTYSVFLVWPATANAISVASFSGFVGAMSVTDLSVKELLGNHASQSTPNSRPYLRARHNLLTYSQEFDNTSVWSTVAASITPNSTTAPDGTTSADTITFSSGSGRVQRTINMALRCLSIYVKPIVGTRFAINTDGVSYSDATVFDLTGNGSIIHTGANNNSSSITLLSNGWYRLVTARGSTAGTNIYLGALNAAGGSTDSFYIWGADLRYGSLPGTYQRTTASSYSTTGTLDYDPVGQKTYLWFDGIDDSLVTNSINFSGTDKMSVCAGVTKLSDAAAGLLVELSATSASNLGTFGVFAPGSVAAEYTFQCSGSSLAARRATTYTSPVTNVLFAGFDNAQSTTDTEVVPRINGATPTLTNIIGPAGTGNFSTYPLYIGRRNNASFPFNGLLYNLMIIGTQVDPVNIQKAERFVADKTGITI